MLEIRNVTVAYGRVRALSEVSLVVGEHEVVALVGSNGAGKTTLLRTVSGLISPEKGEILYNGTRISGMEAYAVTALGIIHVPEGRKIFYRLSVHENLMMGAYIQKDKNLIRQNYDRVLATFPVLKQRLRQPGGTLSGGEQQMLAFGRALMAAPKLLLLDEPSLGLAPLIVDTIADNIVAVAKSGIPILLVEQNANLALEISDRAYVLETGRIEYSGNSAELAANGTVQKTYLGIA